MKVFGVTGWKNAGKTTLVAKLVTELTARGLRVSTIKRTHHNVDLDRPGTDSFAHRSAGAEEVMLTSDQRYAILKEMPPGEPPKLADLLARMAPVDLVLVEGFKHEAHAKIECHRAGGPLPLIAESNETIKLIATDAALNTPVPQIDINAITDIADFVMREVGLGQSPRQPKTATTEGKIE